MNHKEFFNEYGHYEIESESESIYSGEGMLFKNFSIEELAQAIEDRIMEKEEEQYQRFKARLIDEVKAVHSTESPLSGNGWETYEYFEYPLIDISGEAGADLVEKE